MLCPWRKTWIKFIKQWKYSPFSCSNTNHAGVQIWISLMTPKVVYTRTLCVILGGPLKYSNMVPKTANSCRTPRTTIPVGSSARTVCCVISAILRWRGSITRINIKGRFATDTGATKVKSAPSSTHSRSVITLRKCAETIGSTWGTTNTTLT